MRWTSVGMIRGAQFTAVARLAEHICRSKRPYKTKAIALTCASTFIKVSGTDRRFEAYRCPACRNWHLTTIKESSA